MVYLMSLCLKQISFQSTRMVWRTTNTVGCERQKRKERRTCTREIGNGKVGSSYLYRVLKLLKAIEVCFNSSSFFFPPARMCFCISRRAPYILFVGLYLHPIQPHSNGSTLKFCRSWVVAVCCGEDLCRLINAIDCRLRPLTTMSSKWLTRCAPAFSSLFSPLLSFLVLSKNHVFMMDQYHVYYCVSFLFLTAS